LFSFDQFCFGAVFSGPLTPQLNNKPPSELDYMLKNKYYPPWRKMSILCIFFLEGLLIYFVAVKTIFTYSRFKPNNENPTPKYV